MCKETADLKHLYRIKEVYNPGEWYEQCMTEKEADDLRESLGGRYTVTPVNYG